METQAGGVRKALSKRTEGQWGEVTIENNNEALTGANIHYGGIGDIFYVVPAFDGTNVTVTMKGG